MDFPDTTAWRHEQLAPGLENKNITADETQNLCLNPAHCL
jgi:hypothetical protein